MIVGSSGFLYWSRLSVLSLGCLPPAHLLLHPCKKMVANADGWNDLTDGMRISDVLVQDTMQSIQSFNILYLKSNVHLTFLFLHIHTCRQFLTHQLARCLMVNELLVLLIKRPTLTFMLIHP